MNELKQAHRYNDALRLAIQQKEVDEIMDLLAQRGDVSVLFKCFKPQPLPPRSLEFVAAIRAYDWTLASALATTVEEKQDIEDSISRVDRLLRLKAAGRYGEALEIAILQSELDELHKLKEKYGERGGNCLTRCLGCFESPLDPVRSPEFIEAIRNYDWPLANELCTTLEERQDIEDSIARVDEMIRLKTEGRYDEALKLAVLQKEAEDINDMRKRGVAATGRGRQISANL